MLTIMFFYLAISVISACILILFLRKAPVGWEDESGFHSGNGEMANISTGEFQRVI
ncbi:MAG: hypothetical protein P4L45_05385 [Ignavibacteriaceae bacterium]|nr:hypothetical protein [Ignavibacteriaceae bacterium]